MFTFQYVHVGYKGEYVEKSREVIAKCKRKEKFRGTHLFKNVALTIPPCPPSGTTDGNRIKVSYEFQVCDFSTFSPLTIACIKLLEHFVLFIDESLSFRLCSLYYSYDVFI